MKHKLSALLLCAGFGAPLLSHAIEWEPVGSGSSSDIDGSYSSGQYQRQQNDQSYESNTGTRYQYDMSNPVERNRYSLDLDAQRRDMQSADPRRNTDRSSGQYGGGILDD